MFRITRDPSSGSLIQCWAQITVSVGMEVVGVIAAYAAITPRTITVISAKHCVRLPDDGSLVIRNMLGQF